MKKAEYDTSADMNQSAYSALVNGQTVCAGYARAFQYLMQQLNIPCYYCTGYSGQDHAWNIIKLEQKYYNVDVTWDDTTPSTYDYYNKSDAEFADTHVRKGLSVYLPVCGSNLDAGFDSDADSDSGFSGDDVGQNETDSENYLINPNPQEPISWQSTWNGNSEQNTNSDEEKEASVEEKLAEAGITEDEVLSTLKDYYADCLVQMVEVGAGEGQFTNVIPEELWATIESVYNDNSFHKGYVDEALKKLEMENFAIQLQAQRLGGGYYRLYHNISSWN